MTIQNIWMTKIMEIDNLIMKEELSSNYKAIPVLLKKRQWLRIALNRVLKWCGYIWDCVVVQY